MPDSSRPPRGHAVALTIVGFAVFLVGFLAVWSVLHLSFFGGPTIDLGERGAPPAPLVPSLPLLRVGVVAMYGPEETHDRYARLIHVLGKRLDRDARLVIRARYADLRFLLESGEIDVGFFCTGPYALMAIAGTAELLVQPELLPGLTYHSAVIVPTDSPASRLDELAGQPFAYSDPESHTGCLVVRQALRDAGYDPDRYFGHLTYAGSHDRAVDAVATHCVAGAAVHSLVLADMLRRDPTLAEKIKVIWRSQSFGPPPVVVPTDLDADLRERLLQAFLALHDQPGMDAELAELGIRRFIMPRPADYREVLDMYRQMGPAPILPAGPAEP